MSRALIITEKPSVARDLVAALGGFRPQEGGAYWESDAYVCTFAVGHILTLLEPEDLDPAYKSWRLETLPIVPRRFQYKPVSGHEKRLDVIGRLLKRPDVDRLINACDAAREGELIFREIVEFFGAAQPVRRLWLQSMTPEAIRKGFDILRSGTDLKGLSDAAACRAESDWLIGMNATRAFSVKLRGPERESKPWSVGRVQTPTLALLVERELAVLSHRPRAFQRIKARFAAVGHEYDGVWHDPKWKKQDDLDEGKDDRIFDVARAEAIVRAVTGQAGIATETREESQRQAPWLFNLTALQKNMATRYKWSSKRTLEAAQRCYEQHKVLTYPRTSSSCLPTDYPAEVDKLVDLLAGVEPYAPHAAFLLKNGRRNEKRVFDDAGVSDHFAIIPTGKIKDLDGDDAKLFDVVVRRFLATFYPPAVYDRVKRETVVLKEHHFRTGPVDTLVDPGWMAVHGKEVDDGEKLEKLPPLKSPAVKVREAKISAEQTKAPPRIAEAQLLSLMENAGRSVEDEELAKALMSAEGLGTAATRADIIQNLKAKQYIDEGLRPTAKGIQLVTVLRKLPVARLTSAELTAKLELELTEVERGKRRRERFMADTAAYTEEIVDAARSMDPAALYPDREPLGPCPLCKQFLVYERPWVYACASYRKSGPGCEFRIAKEFAGRYVDRVTASELVVGGASAELDGLRDGAGKPFRSLLRVARDGELRLDGEAEAPRGPGRSAETSRRGKESGSGATAPRRSGATATPPIAPCPVHGPACAIIATRGAYICEQRLEQFRQAAGDAQAKLTGFWIPRVICGRDLTEPELKKLLERGATPSLAGFTGRSGRAFVASLHLTPEGGFRFEFSPNARS